jgi:IclR family acetate operon transcriptional repressor
MATDDPVGVLDRITVIFEILGDDDRGMGVSELAQRAGLPKSTVSRLVSGLVSRHYLERDGTTIRLGLRLFELGQLAETPQKLRHTALPIMTGLRNDTGATVELAIRDGADMVLIAVVRGRTTHPAGRVGQRTPAREPGPWTASVRVPSAGIDATISLHGPEADGAAASQTLQAAARAIERGL